MPTTSPAACTGTAYLVNPDAPEEGTDVHHDRPCPVHRDAHGPHVEPCGCSYAPVDLPDDQWIGQGWRNVSQCDEHAAVGVRPCVAEALRPRRRVR